jgi:quercetin dioxygenase-like cupin family protein
MTTDTPHVHILLRSEQSSDAVGIIELTFPAGWDGPPLHHHDFDEAFYVLEGQVTFQLADKLKTAEAGELIFAPRGSHHTLANLGDEQARYVLVCTPGEFTRYFERLSAQLTWTPPPDASKRYPETIVVGPTIAERLRRAA